jgi:phosphate transport system permease protein
VAAASATALPVEVDDLRRAETPLLRWRVVFDKYIAPLTALLFLVAILPILDVVYYVGARALPTLTFGVLTDMGDYQVHDALGVPIETTFLFMLLATAISVALGLFGGVATAEFLGDRAAGWVRMSANMLAGMPSVIVGYFGYFAFVLYFGWGLNFLAGVFTLAFFMTPYIYRTADLAFTSIPRPIREAAIGSGAKPHQYILKVGTPIAFPQILNGVFLAMAIGVGETAPIILTTQPGLLVPSGPFQPAVFMTYLIWTGFSQPPASNPLTLAFQAAFLIIVTVLALNIVVRIVSARYRKRLEGLYQ